MTKQITISLKDELADKLARAAEETCKTEPAVIREVLHYFLEAWLEAERAKLETVRKMTGQTKRESQQSRRGIKKRITGSGQ